MKIIKLKRLNLICTFILVCTLYVFASSETETRMSLKMENVTLKEVFETIESRSNYLILVSGSDVNLGENVSIDVTNKSIKEILDEVIMNKNLSYAVKDNHIIIYKLDKKEVVASVKQQGRQITGRVVDAAGEAIIGANVIEKGTQNGAITDVNGNFSLRVSEGAVLQVSYVGFLPIETAVGNRTTVNITIMEDTQTLEELVVVGYGVQRKATVTGSVVSVGGEKLIASPSTNLTNSLAGRLPGLVAFTRTGEPGNDASTLRIRGVNTLGNENNEPLIVVDGIPNRSLDRLNPGDIENISILKDASAAIYGSQAANGVILVTTKRGTQGKTNVSLRYNEGQSMLTAIPKAIDAPTYMEMLNEIQYYLNLPPPYSQEEISNWRANMGSDPWKYPNTDWYGEVLKKSAPQRDATLTISGGQEKLNYFVSAGALFQDAIYKNSATTYNQENFRINLDGKFSDYVKYGIDVSGLQYTRNYPTREAGTIFTFLRRGRPNSPAIWPDGRYGPDISDGDNPAVIATSLSGYDKYKSFALTTAAKLEIIIPWVKGLSVSGNAAYDRTILNRKTWRIPWYLYNWDRKTYGPDGLPLLSGAKKGVENPELTQRMEDTNRLTLNALANYNTSIKNIHNIRILFGTERRSGGKMEFEAFRKYFVSDAIDELFAGGDAEKSNTGKSEINARLSYFGRVNYDFSSKYLFEFVWRYDGSYIFHKDSRFGFFPGVSLGWRISEEKFWQNTLSFINNFKIRGSWGQTGNDRINPYQYLSSFGFLSRANEVYTFNYNSEKKVLNELRIPNSGVTWEVANQANVGFDGQMLNGKLSFEFDYFNNIRDNILWARNASVPTSTGLTLPRENIGRVANRGFEVQLSYADRAGDFQYRTALNLSLNKNKILFWDETPGVPEYQKSTGYPIPTDIGTYGNNLYYKAIGIFQTKEDLEKYPKWVGARLGDIIFEDVNNDGKIDGLDRIRTYKNETPTHTGGFTIDLSYKQVYMNIFFQWATGAVRYDYYEMQGETGNYLVRDVEGRWTESNPTATKPRIWNRYAEYWRNNRNTYWLQNSDYLRLKNCEIGYNLPASITKKMRVNGIQLYFTGLNLLTFTEIKDFDPESNSGTVYPLNKVYNIGININF